MFISNHQYYEHEFTSEDVALRSREFSTLSMSELSNCKIKSNAQLDDLEDNSLYRDPYSNTLPVTESEFFKMNPADDCKYRMDFNTIYLETPVGSDSDSDSLSAPQSTLPRKNSISAAGLSNQYFNLLEALSKVKAKRSSNPRLSNTALSNKLKSFSRDVTTLRPQHSSTENSRTDLSESDYWDTTTGGEEEGFEGFISPREGKSSGTTGSEYEQKSEVSDKSYQKDTPLEMGEILLENRGIGDETARVDIQFWLNILEPDADELKQLQVLFNLHALTLEDIMLQTTREKIEEYPNYIYIVYKIRQQIPNCNAFRDININLILFPGLVLSIILSPVYVENNVIHSLSFISSAHYLPFVFFPASFPFSFCSLSNLLSMIFYPNGFFAFPSHFNYHDNLE